MKLETGYQLLDRCFVAKEADALIDCRLPDSAKAAARFTEFGIVFGAVFSAVFGIVFGISGSQLCQAASRTWAWSSRQ